MKIIKVKAKSRVMQNDIIKYLKEELETIGYKELVDIKAVTKEFDLLCNISDEDGNTISTDRKTFKEIKEDTLLYVLSNLTIGEEPF